MKRKIFISIGILIIFAIALVSFKPYFPTSPEKYLAKLYGDKNANCKRTKIGNLELAMKIIPAEAMALRSIQPQYTKDRYKEALLNYERTLNFVFSIQGDKGNDLITDMAKSSQDYEEMVKYLAFEIKNDFILFNQLDTLNCTFSHFERTYNLDSKITVSGTFVIPSYSPLLNNPEPFTIGYNADVLNMAVVNFYFRKSDLLKKPNLIF